MDGIQLCNHIKIITKNKKKIKERFSLWNMRER